MAGDEQEVGEGAQFGRGEPVVLRGAAVRLRGEREGADEGGEQIVRGCGAALVLDEFVEVGRELPDGVLSRFLGGRGDHLVRPRAEGVAVGGGDAQEFADHDDRQREGQRVDEVGPAGRQHRVQEIVRDPLDAGPQRLGPARVNSRLTSLRSRV